MYMILLAYRLVRNQGDILKACSYLVKNDNAEYGQACKPLRASSEGRTCFVTKLAKDRAIRFALRLAIAPFRSRRSIIYIIRGTHESVNHLLVVGFYLLNIGYILLALKTNKDINSLRVSIEFLSQQVGIVLLVLGVLHFLNVLIISQWRTHAMSKNQLRADGSLSDEQR